MLLPKVLLQDIGLKGAWRPRNSKGPLVWALRGLNLKHEPQIVMRIKRTVQPHQCQYTNTHGYKLESNISSHTKYCSVDARLPA